MCSSDLQDALSTEIEELAASIAADEKDLAAATKIRGEENTEFKAIDKELTEVIDSLNRAIGLIEREMAKGGASMMQLKSANSLKQVFNVMVQASSMNTADAQKLAAFVQSSNDDDDFEVGAPAGAMYENQSGGIVDVLQGLLDQANEQLDKMRAVESSALHNYQQLKQSLETSLKYANDDLDESKKGLAASQEGQATAQGDLDITSKDLAEDQKALAGLHQTCMERATEFETEAKSRSEEMKGLEVCKDAMKKIQIRGTSFLQMSLAGARVPRQTLAKLRNLAHTQNDAVLSQLASRMSSTVAIGSKSGEDIFAKIKTQIEDSIAKIQEEQAADATQKVYCDKELGEAKEKVETNQKKIEKHTTKIEQKSSNSLRVKEEVAALQESLAKLNKEKLEMDNLRQEEKAAFDKNEADTAQSLSEIKFALKTLRDFYAEYEKTHTGFSSSDGTAAGLIAMLETVESEFSTTLAQLKAVEGEAVAAYDAEVKTFETEHVVKEKGIKYKTKEHISLDKYASDETTDREGVQSELDANHEALSKLNEMCVGKADTYEDRVAERQR